MLAFAAIAVAAGFTVLALVVGFTGSAADGDPVVTLDLGVASGEGGSPARITEATASPRLVAGQLVADPALLEETETGVVPVVAPDGRRAMDAYARPFNVPPGRPRIGIVITGLGINPSVTARAIEALPPEITLSFSPFVTGVQEQVDEARAKGHEVLVEVPMEPMDYPNSDPGTRALMVAASAEENGRRLLWSLSRFTGYVGVTNLLGSRYLSDANALEPTLGILGRRGLLFLETSASGSSAVAESARKTGTPTAIGTLVLDGQQTPEAVDAQLLEVEAEARRTNGAIAAGFSYPVTIDRVALWARDLDERGFALAPVSVFAATTMADR